jgi:hypothetical protein
MNIIEALVQVQTYVLMCDGERIEINGRHLPLTEAREYAEIAGRTCLIYHSSGIQYVYPN